MPLGKDNLTAAEVGRLLGLSVHTLSYWRQRGQGPRTIQAGRPAGRPGSRIGDAGVATRGNTSMRARVAGRWRLVRLRGNTDPIGLIAGRDGS